MASVAVTHSCADVEPVPGPLDLIRESTEILQEKFELGNAFLEPSHCQFIDGEITEDLNRASTEVLQEQFELQQMQQLQVSHPGYHADMLFQSPACGFQSEPPMYGVIAMPFNGSFPQPAQPCMEPIPGQTWSEYEEALALQQFHNMTAYTPGQHILVAPADAVVPDVAATAATAPELAPSPRDSSPAASHPDEAIGGNGHSPRILAPQVPQRLHTEVFALDENTKVLRAIFTVPESKLDSRCRMAISQQPILVPFQGGNVPFKIKVSAKEMHKAKHGQCFKTSHGVGKVEIKCEDLYPEDAPPISFTVAVGRGEYAQGVRGPVTHNFRQTSVAGLPDGEAYWDFKTSVDASTRSFDIAVDFQLPQC